MSKMVVCLFTNVEGVYGILTFMYTARENR